MLCVYINPETNIKRNCDSNNSKINLFVPKIKIEELIDFKLNHSCFILNLTIPALLKVS